MNSALVALKLLKGHFNFGGGGGEIKCQVRGASSFREAPLAFVEESQSTVYEEVVYLSKFYSTTLQCNFYKNN